MAVHKADFFLDFYQMHTRNGCCGVMYRERMYLWGGQTSRRTTPAEEYGVDSDDSDGGSDVEEIVVPINLPKEDDPYSVIDVYDIGDKLWWHCPTHGDVPRMGLGPRVCVFDHSLYLYGGWNKYNFNSDLFRLDLRTYEWRKVALSSNVKPTPVYLTTMMVYEGRIVTFGGVGLRVTAEKLEESGAVYHQFSDKPQPWGWNNEYHEFSFKDSCWTAYKLPNCPPPVSAMDMVMVDNHRAVLYGGRTRDGRSRRVFLLNLQRREWLEPAHPPEDPAVPWPSIRTFHTLTCLHDPSTVGNLLYGQQVYQKVLLLGGKHEDAWISHEEWLLEIVEDNITWTKLDLGVKPPRSWHIACTHYPSMGQTEVFLFGGNKHIKPDEEERVDAADLRILSWVMSGALSSQLAWLHRGYQMRVGGFKSYYKVSNQVLGVARLRELCLRAASSLPDGHLQSLVKRNVLPVVLAEAVLDHRRKMRVYQPHAIVLPEGKL